MANVNKVKVNNTVYDIEDTVARSSTVTMSSRADGSVSLSSASAGTSVNVPSLTNFGDPGLLENDAVTEINNLKTDVDDLYSAIAQGVGLTSDIKQALMTIVNHVVWDDDDPTGQTYIDDLYDALYPPASLIGISAVYTQGATEVLSTDSLDVLKSNLVVTGSYDDSSTRAISGYTLSGNLTSPTATITVSYEGFTTTFNVAVTYVDNSLYNWNFTQSLVDSKQGATATLPETGVTQSSAGLTFTNSNQVHLVSLGSLKRYTIEIDITNIDSISASVNTQLYTLTSSSTATSGSGGLGCNGTSGWRFKDVNGSWHAVSGGDEGVSNTATTFNGKTMKICIDEDISKTYSLYVNNALVGSTTFTATFTQRNYATLVGGTNRVITGVRIYEGIV